MNFQRFSDSLKTVSLAEEVSIELKKLQEANIQQVLDLNQSVPTNRRRNCRRFTVISTVVSGKVRAGPSEKDRTRTPAPLWGRHRILSADALNEHATAPDIHCCELRQ
jgi:hypothetical protein